MKITKNNNSAARKYLLTIPIGLALTLATSIANAQTPPPASPPPPPSPKEMLNKITSPFKKVAKDDSARRAKRQKTADSVQKAGPPSPTPPLNPLNFFKKKKPATTPVKSA